NHSSRIFAVGSSSQQLSLVVGISGLTIANGNSSTGGGLYNSGTLTVSNCTFTGNAAGSSGGGGIYNNGALTVNNSTFSSSSINGTCTSDGSAFDSDGTANVTYCTVTCGSVGSEGGGIDNHGTLTIRNSTLTGNTSQSRGGAINSSGPITITNCTITGNRVA